MPKQVWLFRPDSWCQVTLPHPRSLAGRTGAVGAVGPPLRNSPWPARTRDTKGIHFPNAQRCRAVRNIQMSPANGQRWRRCFRPTRSWREYSSCRPQPRRSPYRAWSKKRFAQSAATERRGRHPLPPSAPVRRGRCRLRVTTGTRPRPARHTNATIIQRKSHRRRSAHALPDHMGRGHIAASRARTAKDQPRLDGFASGFSSHSASVTNPSRFKSVRSNPPDFNEASRRLGAGKAMVTVLVVSQPHSAKRSRFRITAL